MLQLGVIALRNILKNSRRTVVIIIAIALGFAAVSLFRGYTDYMFGNLRKIAIRGEGLGHLTLYHKGWFKRGKLEPENHMFSRDEVDKIMDIVKKDNDILLATPQLDIQGLVSNGGTTTIFLAKGVVPRDDEIIRGEFAQSQIKKGSALQNGKTEGIEMAVGLAEAGANIALVDILDMTESKELIEKLGRKCIAITADLSKKEREIRSLRQKKKPKS